MDIIKHVANHFINSGFNESAQVSAQTLVSNSSVGFSEHIEKEISPCKRFYKVSGTRTYGDRTYPVEHYENLDGNYVGDADTMHTIYNQYGINPELAVSSDSVCTVGQSDQDDLWYGWSHRAISGFPTREEAVKFAASVSSVQLSDILSPFYSESAPARKQKPEQFNWFRFGGSRTASFKDETSSIKIASGMRFGIRYASRTKQILIISEESQSNVVEISERQATNITKNSKVTRGKIFGVAVKGESGDFLLAKDRKAFDKASSTEVKPKTPKTPKEPKEPKEPKTPKTPKTPERSVEVDEFDSPSGSRGGLSRRGGRGVTQQTGSSRPPKKPKQSTVAQPEPAPEPPIAKPKEVKPKIPNQKIKEEKTLSEEESGNVVVREMARNIGVTPPESRRRPYTKYHWVKYTGTRTRKLYTTDAEDELEAFIDDGDVLGFRYEPKMNELIFVLVKDDPSILFEATYSQARLILKDSRPFTGQIQKKKCSFSKAEVQDAIDEILSRAFKSKYEALLDEEQNAMVKVTEALATPDTFALSGKDKKEQKEIEAALDTGETIGFAVGEVNVGQERCRVVFGAKPKEAATHLQKFMSKQSGENVWYGDVSAANNLYRLWVKQGSAKAGLDISRSKMSAIIRDSNNAKKIKNDLHDSTLSVEVPEANTYYKPTNLSPVFKGNDREVLNEIARAMVSMDAYTKAYKVAGKLKTLKSGRLALVLRAAHNSDKYRKEGEQAIRRMQFDYKSKQIVGKFTEKNGELLLVVVIAALAGQTQEDIDHAIAMRYLMTNGSEATARRRGEMHTKIADLRKSIEALEKLGDDARAELVKLAEEKTQYELTYKHTLDEEIYNAKMADFTRRIKRLQGIINSSMLNKATEETRVEQMTREAESKETAIGSIWATKDGTQVKLIRADYTKGKFLVSNVGGSRTQNELEQKEIRIQLTTLSNKLNKGVASEQRDTLLDQIEDLSKQLAELGSEYYSRSYHVKHLYTLSGEKVV